ncbi:MAG: gamma-glutamylcyclotransferase family protein, partial [Prochlorothrix sp.]
MAHLTVFVYGTLKPGERNHVSHCQPGLLSDQAAQIPGQIYHLPQGYPALVDGPGWVRGVILRWQGPRTSIDRRLALLDHLEDYDPRRARDPQGPNLYDRQWRGVYHSPSPNRPTPGATLPNTDPAADPLPLNSQDPNPPIPNPQHKFL